MLGRVARLHYEHGFTHQQIADTLGLSRVKVTRMLAEARSSGIVEIRVHSGESLFIDLELQVAQQYGLRQVWVAPSSPDTEQARRSLGYVAAGALCAALQPGMAVAVALSGTVAAIAPQVRAEQARDALFVPATGIRLPPHDATQPEDVAQQLAKAFGGRSRAMPAPLLTSSDASASLLRDEPDIASTLRLARGAAVALFGVGGTRRGTGMLMDGVLPEATVASLVEAGAVGNVLAAFFDEHGRSVATDLSRRIIGLSAEQLLTIPTRLAVAGGRGKAPAIRGALRAGYANVLVTDDLTAQALLDEVPP